MKLDTAQKKEYVYNSHHFFNCVSTSIADKGLGHLSIFPNPARGIFDIRFSNSISQDVILTLTNTFGDVVFYDRLSGCLGEQEKQIS